MIGRRLLPILILLGWVAQTAWAAPLFPDVRDDHWAHDAVATLAAKGLVEGYPDGTFKGDRAASRWEVAMIVARLLAKMEQEHSTFATKAEMDEIRKLAEALKDELAALGVRVTNLEENTSRLDKRVTELERITFYGYLDAKVMSQTFYNEGNLDNDNLRGGTGAPGVPYVNYNNAVGSNIGPVMRPMNQAVLPVVSYLNGRALTNGTGFTSKAGLGLRIKVSPDIDAEAEFAAYTSQGNQIIDGYWGVPQPYLLNPVTADGFAGSGAQGLNNQPYTRMVLDHFTVRHKPSNTTLILGYFPTMKMDKFVYAGMPNLNAYGPPRLPGYGINVSGDTPISDDVHLQWEALGTRSGDFNNFLGGNYRHIVAGADLAVKFPNGKVQANFARFMDEEPHDAGLISFTNVAFGASTGWTPTQWVNPPGYFALQRDAFQIANTGAVNGTLVPNGFDTRPIAGWNAAADNTVGITAGGGDFGPQTQTTYGLSADYKWQLDPADVEFKAEYGWSDYKSNRISPYVSHGTALRVEAAGHLPDQNLNLSLAFLSIDPNYNPALFSGNLLGIRLVRPWNLTGRFHLHDHVNYPHNREGLQFKGSWKFCEDNGEVWTRVGLLSQKQTSLYDVRVVTSAFGPGVPTNNVIGFSPGFIDSIFPGFATPGIYGPLSANAFDANLQPLENPRGHLTDFGIGGHYRWKDPGIRLDLAYERLNAYRGSSLSAANGGSQNLIDINTDYILAGLTYQPEESWKLRGGVELVHAYGHYDPAGLYNGFATANNQIGFTNVNSIQTVPYLGFDKDISQNLSASLDLRYYITRDQVAGNIQAGTGPGSIGATANPFNWSGSQISTEIHYKF